MLNAYRDYFAGALCILIGIFVVIQGNQLSVGTLSNMGPGYYPTALGLLLALVGAMIAGTAIFGAPTNDDDLIEAPTPDKPDWRGWGCIISGAVSFVVLAKYTGLLLATFACVFLSAIGDRKATFKTCSILALGVTIFGVALFHFGLKINLPLWR
jgi:hypothetical protein